MPSSPVISLPITTPRPVSSVLPIATPPSSVLDVPFAPTLVIPIPRDSEFCLLLFVISLPTATLNCPGLVIVCPIETTLVVCNGCFVRPLAA